MLHTPLGVGVRRSAGAGAALLDAGVLQLERLQRRARRRRGRSQLGRSWLVATPAQTSRQDLPLAGDSRRTAAQHEHRLGRRPATVSGSLVVVTFFNHNFVNCKATLILAIKIYEIKYNIIKIKYKM